MSRGLSPRAEHHTQPTAPTLSSGGRHPARATRLLTVALVALALFASQALALLATPTPAQAQTPTQAQTPAQTQAPAQASGSARTSIIGGSAAGPEDFPWMAFILAADQSGEGFSCSGTVVSPNVVLTAGHCVQDISTGRLTAPEEYRVVTGAADVTDSVKRQVLSVSQAIVFPRFSPTTATGDAGLLILSSPTTAPPIPIATAADRQLYRGGTPITVAGWGLTAGKAKQTPTALRWGVTYVQSQRYCRRQVGLYYPFFVPASQFCAIEPRRFSVGTCHGDSGGPTLARRPDNTFVEIGITSLVGERCTPRLPDVFTRIDRVASWVNGWIAATQPGSTTPPPPTPPPTSRDLPTMTKRQAKAYVALALEHDFGNAFRRARAFQIVCKRVTPQRVRCEVAWLRMPRLYGGRVNVFYSFQRDAISLNARYVIRSVNARCWLSKRRNSCDIAVRRR